MLPRPHPMRMCARTSIQRRTSCTFFRGLCILYMFCGSLYGCGRWFSGLNLFNCWCCFLRLLCWFTPPLVPSYTLSSCCFVKRAETVSNFPIFLGSLCTFLGIPSPTFPGSTSELRRGPSLAKEKRETLQVDTREF